jgi:para-aminobenzoate synthetase/4-amino-4-deoxychorismate lyase
LPGVCRAQALAGGDAAEGELRLDDLAGGFRLGNAVRGMMDAELLA